MKKYIYTFEYNGYLIPIKAESMQYAYYKLKNMLPNKKHDLNFIGMKAIPVQLQVKPFGSGIEQIIKMKELQ